VVRLSNHPIRRPVAVFNPGALLKGRKLYIFPRIVLGYFWYSSAIGVFEVDVEDALEGSIEGPLDTRIIIHPSEPWDLNGCEDPRVSVRGDGGYYVLYTGVAPGMGKIHARARQAVAFIDDGFRLESKGVLRIREEGGVHEIDWWKDSAVVSENGRRVVLLTRPTIRSIEINWRAEAEPREAVVDLESMEPVMGVEEWELKVGWSTNTVRIGSNEYLVGWHGVGRDLIYREGLAVVDGEGRLLGVTDYLLAPASIEELFGDRPGVIFGDGFIIYGEKLLWVGGEADHMIGIYEADLNKVMEKVRWIERA
jgi:predicted GH43/DUF377 family glycosyl hydrolase